MYKYFKIRLRIHTKHRIKFSIYLSLLCVRCMFVWPVVYAFCCWTRRLSFATATFATVIAITIHTRDVYSVLLQTGFAHTILDLSWTKRANTKKKYQRNEFLSRNKNGRLYTRFTASAFRSLIHTDTNRLSYVVFVVGFDKRKNEFFSLFILSSVEPCAATRLPLVE